MTGNLPVPITYTALAAILRGMADLVEQGDSFEGSLEYSLSEFDQDLGPDQVMVRAAFRIGNRQGQGGMRIIGTLGRGG